MIKCLWTELGRAGRENIWLEVRTYGSSAVRSVRPDRYAQSVRPNLESNIFPSDPTTQSLRN